LVRVIKIIDIPSIEIIDGTCRFGEFSEHRRRCLLSGLVI
jgi:hypothetical protein